MPSIDAERQLRDRLRAARCTPLATDAFATERWTVAAGTSKATASDESNASRQAATDGGRCSGSIRSAQSMARRNEGDSPGSASAESASGTIESFTARMAAGGGGEPRIM